MPKPTILMLTPYLPYPPVSGGRMRTYNLLKHLCADYDITLVCFGRPEETAFDISPLRAYCDVVVVNRDPSPGTLQAAMMSLTSPQPITMRLYGTQAMRQAVEAVITARGPQVIHVESFYMRQNLPPGLGIPVLLSEPAIEHRVWARHARVATPWYTRPGIAIEALKMRQTEPRVWASADLVGAMSEVDLQYIQQAAPSAEVVMTPNGVDVNFFQPDETTPRDSCTGMYMGDYKYFPNTDAVLYFAEAILPLIKARRPDFKLLIVGKDPTPEMLALAQTPDSGITITGLVEDTRPYLQSSAVFICPLRSGSGTRFKLLEALASGCPVVSTALGCEGLGAVDGRHMLIRDEPQAFAEAVLRLLDDPQQGQAMSRAGREWVVQKHAWQHSAALVKAAYQRLMGA